MSLLTISIQVADSVGLPRPSAVASSTDQLPRQMLALANETLEELCEMDWPLLEVTHTFNTVANQDTYALPANFNRIVTDSAYVASQYYALRGSLSSADWYRNRNSLPSQIGRYKFRIFGNPLSIVLTPKPMTVENIVLEYVTSNRVKDTGGNFAQNYTADTDVSIIPESVVRKGLKWRIKHAKGLDYSEDFNDYEITKQRVFAQQLAAGSMPVAFRNMIDVPELPNGFVPEFGYGS
jgi:hypothetical protein